MADHSATLTLVLPRVELDARAKYNGPRTTDTSNGFNGAECGGGAIVEKNPPVATGSYPLPQFVDTAIAFPMPELNAKGWPISDSFVNPKRLSRASHVDRVEVGHRDITWFRATDPGDAPTAMPGYTLTEPYGYGASQILVIPRTNSLFEKYGQGSLAWLRQGAPVRYSRVYAIGTEDQVVKVDYRGIVLAVLTDELEFRVSIGGEISARVGLAYKPPVKYRKLYDLGSLMSFACRTFGIRLFPPGGPDTGLTAPNEGGVDWNSHMNKIAALSRTADVPQRALMPTVWGGPRYAFEPKDTTTVHGTWFADGTTVAVRLVDDVSEQPTGVYGNGVTPEGERWDGAVYPGVVQGPPSKYPFNDNRDFGLGTTDSGTDSGFGVTALRHKLVWDNLLPDSMSSGSTYDSHVVNGVKALQEAAGQAADGTMTPAAWKALWDSDVVGYSLEGARVLPLAQAEWISSYLLSAGGDVIARNPKHIPGAIRVDMAFDYDVVDQAVARAHARKVIKAGYGHQWAGTVTANAVHGFAGDVTDEDIASLTEADIMCARDYRPGMNIKLPHFEDGTLLHIAQAKVTPGEAGDTVEFTVDTGFRDIFDLAAALKRNKESRRSPFREFIRTNQGIKPPGRFITRDKYCGKLYQDVRLAGGRWNSFTFVLGQSGTIGRTDVLLQDIATEYCIVVFAEPVDPNHMQRIIGNPWQLDANGQTAFEHESTKFLQDRRVMLYLAGAGQQPAGYGWKKGYVTNAAGILVRSANPLTGQHLDDSSWSYATDPRHSPLAYALCFPRRSATVRRGRLFYALEDDAT